MHHRRILWQNDLEIQLNMVYNGYNHQKNSRKSFMKDLLQKKIVLNLYIAVYFFVNILTLTRYPLVHSDEVWLAGLTKTMMGQRSLLVTEPFFDLAPRAPHTLKVLFHTLQMPFMAMSGYNLFSVRLLSLMFGTAFIALILQYFNQRTENVYMSMGLATVFALNSQLVYASHFARQEILLLTVLMVCYHLYRKGDLSKKNTWLISGIIGLSIAIHPNAFIVAVMIGCLYVLDWFYGKIAFADILHYCLPMSVFALMNISVTLVKTPDFLADYGRYARNLSVDAPPSARWQNFLDFYDKLWHQISGTYFLPHIGYMFITALFILFATLILLAIRKTDIKKTLPVQQCLAMFFGLNVALFIIGRFNPTSICFGIFLLCMIIAESILLIPYQNLRPYLLLVVLLIFANGLYRDASIMYQHDYNDYSAFIEDSIEEDAVVLGNLSSGFAFSQNQFYDIRNLAYLDGLSFEDYIKRNGINTIIYYEEYDYIHRNEAWQILYGDDSGYYDHMTAFISSHCRSVATLDAPYYGNRIIRYIDGYPWQITVYRIASETND